MTIRDALRLWWPAARLRHGARGALKGLAAELVDFIRESTPRRRRALYGDMEYDWEYRVDTTAVTISARERLLGAIMGAGYQPCDPALFHGTIRMLSIDYAQFQFIDLGSGKGRALLLASDYPFRRIIGVELLPNLHRVAVENVRRYRSESQRCFAIETLQGDARTYVFPPGPLVLFLFNPLPEPALERVVTNLVNSLQRSSRPVFIVYHNPVLERFIASVPGMRRIAGTLQYAIYANRTAAAAQTPGADTFPVSSSTERGTAV